MRITVFVLCSALAACGGILAGLRLFAVNSLARARRQQAGRV